MSKKIFLGIGAGPIQTGIFVSGASKGSFDRIVVAEVDDTIRKHNMIKLRLSHRGEMACEAIYMLDDTAEVDE